MTGQSSAGPVRLLLRAPPHLPFVQAYPGIIPGGNRPAATVQGTVEVRTSAGVKAKWVRVQIQKHESVPSSLAGNRSGQSSTTHVGAPHLLWKPPDGKEFDELSTADFRFCMPFPGDTPPSTEMRGCKISYELIAAVCYKGKGGLFKKDSTQMTKVSEEIRITKYELASAWPAYNQLEQRTASALNGAVQLVVDRPSQAFGPGDRIVVTATLKSAALNAFRLKGFDMVLTEIMTIHPPKPDPKKKAKAPSPPIIKRTSVGTTRVTADGQIAPGSERGARLDLVVPQDRQLLTVRGAREFAVEYELVVEATCDGGPGKVLLGGLQCIIGTFPRSAAQNAVKEIGFVQGLCPRPPHQPTPSLPPSVTGSSVTGSQDNHLAPSRGHQSSMSHDGLLTPDANSYFGRPMSGRLSMSPGSPSPPPPLMLQQGYAQPPHHLQPANPQQGYGQGYGQQQGQQGYTPTPTSFPPLGYPPNQRPPQGFVARRTSSGTTATTTTTYTDYGPPPERNASTMPVAGRGSMGFPSPGPHRGSEGGFGPTYEESESLYDRRSSDLSGSTRSPLTPGMGTFGQWNPANHPALDRVTNSSSPTTTMTTADDVSVNQHTLRPESMPPARAAAWGSAANEKQRLYEEARDRAANTQAAHGTVLSHIGMGAGAVPSGAPPEYTPSVSSVQSAPPPQPSTPAPAAPRSPHGSPQSVRSANAHASTTTPLRVVSGPVSASPANGSAIPAPPSEDPVPYDSIFGPGPSGAPPGRDSPAAAAHLSAAHEKDLMRQRYEDAQRGVARGASPSVTSVNGHAQGIAQAAGRPGAASPSPSANGLAYARVAPDWHGSPGSQGSLSAQYTGERSAGPYQQTSRPQTLPAEYMSSAQEKEMMRKRYEEATGAVGRAAGGASNAQAQAQAPASPPPAASALPAAYMSAEQEKEMMRKRYEEATGAVGRAAGVASAQGSSYTAPPPGSPPAASSAAPSAASTAIPAAYMSAEQEKEQMRKRYEAAAGAVGRAAGVTSPPPASPPAASSSTLPAAYMSAEQEKEMMRKRYEEATGAVDRAAGVNQASSSTAPPPASPPPAASSSALPAAYMSAEQEKEMMRKRYEEATGAVDRAAGQASAVQQQPTGPPPGPSTSLPAAYMSAEQEKEQMRKRYEEAAGAVDRAAGANHQAPSSYTAPAAASSSALPAAYMSAEQEKEQMRRRYEAAAGAVGRAAGVSSPPPASPPSAGPSTSSLPAAYMSAEQEKEMMRKRYEAATGAVDRAAGANRQASSSSTAPPGSPPPAGPSASSLPAAYMSAEQEKEQMRKRYEAATGAVGRAAGVASPPPASPPAAASSKLPAAYMSAEQEKEMMRKRYEAATGAVDRAAAGQSSSALQQQPTGASQAQSSASALPAAYMSAEQEKDMMRKRYEAATGAVTRAAGGSSASAGPSAGPSGPAGPAGSPPPDQPISYDELFGPAPGAGASATLPAHLARGVSHRTSTDRPGLGHAPQRSMTLRERMNAALPDGPPPPLAPRPPREYVERFVRRE